MCYILYRGIDFTYAWDVLYLQLSKKDHGEYKATLKDDRGQDVSILEIAGKGKSRSLLLKSNAFHQRGECYADTLATVHVVSLAERNL